MTLSDWELWACASKLVLHHQSAALGEALAKADQMLERGDEDGQTAWLAIAQRIIAIQSDGGTTH